MTEPANRQKYICNEWPEPETSCSCRNIRVISCTEYFTYTFNIDGVNAEIIRVKDSRLGAGVGRTVRVAAISLPEN